MVQQALSAYRRWGPKEGDIVNIPMVHEATAIMLCQLEEIPKPYKLEALCAHTVDNQMTGYSNDLPLPKPITECFEDGHYYYQVGGSFSMDDEFNDPAKELPALLWKHLGCTIVQSPSRI